MRILVAIDGSDDANAAVAWLGRLPVPADRSVRLLTAVALPTLPDGGDPTPSTLFVEPVRAGPADSADGAARSSGFGAAWRLRSSVGLTCVS